MAGSEADIAALERISTSVALTKEDDLEALVGKLLCPVILKMGAEDSALRTAVLKLVSLLNTRIKAAPTLKLPATDLINVFRENSGSPLIANVALMELVMALERSSSADLHSLIGKLAEGVSKTAGKHKRDLLHLTFFALTSLSAGVKAGLSSESLRAAMPFLAVKEDRAEVLRFGTNLIFYSSSGDGNTPPPPPHQQPSMAAPAGTFGALPPHLTPNALHLAGVATGPSAARQGSGEATAQLQRLTPFGTAVTMNPVNGGAEASRDSDGGGEVVGLPAGEDGGTIGGGRREPGLSYADSEELSLAPAGLEIDAEGLVQRRLALLKLFMNSEDLTPAEIALPTLAASCDSNEQVSRAAEDILRKKATLDGLSPAVDMENEEFVARVFVLLAGSPRGTPAAVSKLPAAPPLKIKLYRLCCKSAVSCNMMPRTLEVIDAGISRWLPQVQQAACEYVVWVLQHASEATMATLAGPALHGTVAALQKLPGGSSGAHLPLRGFLYQAVGQLAQRAPKVFGADVETAARFFNALATEPDGIRATVQEAINRLASAFKALPSASVRRDLQRMLDAQSRSASESVRTCAVTWAVEVFPFDDPFARTMCMRAAADVRPGIRNTALKGLGLQSSFQSGALSALKAPLGGGGAAAAAAAAAAEGGDTTTAADSAAARPSFGKMLAAVHSAFPVLRAPPVRSDLAVPADTLSAIVAFLNSCQEQQEVDGSSAAAASKDETMKDADTDAEGNAGGTAEDEEMQVEDEESGQGKNVPLSENLVYGCGAHVAVLEHGVVREAPTELQLLSLSTLLRIASSDPEAAASHFKSRLPFVRAFVFHTSPDVRLTAARLLGAMSQALRSEATSSLLTSLLARLPGSGSGTPDSAAEKAESAADAPKVTVAKYDELHGSVLALGLIASGACMRDGTAGEQFGEVARGVAGEMCHGDIGVATAAARGLGFMQMTGFEVLPLGEVEEAGMKDLEEKVMKTAPKSAAGGAAPETMMQVCGKLTTLITDPRHSKDLKTRLPLVCACGHLAARTPQHACRTKLIELLLSQTPPSTMEDMHAAVGESLSLALSGAESSVASGFLFTQNTKLSKVLLHVTSSSSLNPQDDVTLYTLAQAAQAKGGVVHGAEKALKEKVLECSVKRALSGSVAESAAAAVWLVSFLMFSGGDEVVRERLDKLQGAFVHLMGHASSDLAQDMASYGLAAVYTTGDEAAKQCMASTLVETLTGATGPPLPTTSAAASSSSSKPATDSAAEAATKPSATAQGALATYKDLCMLAVSLERPQLLYALIDVAAEATPHSARRGTLLGVRSSSVQASRKLLEGHAAALLPKLYRGSYDPNPRVAESMSHILVTVIPQRTAALTHNFPAVMRELLESLAARPWRARQAACLAMADLLPGRRWPLLAPHFGRVWEVALRVADDIKDSVRVNGERLLRSIGNLTERLADSKQTPAAEASASLAVAMPILVEKGLQFRSASVRNACITTLAAVVAVAGPADIAPQLAPLISGLLEALSSLESSVMGQIEMEVAKRGMDVSQLDEKRVQMANRSPLQGALDTCARLVDESGITDVTTAVAALLKSAIGVNTRTGAARFIVALTTRLPAATLQKPAGEFLKALLPAVKSERRAVTQRAFAGAIGALGKCASAKRLEWLVGEVATMMELEDEQERLAGALTLLQITRTSADRLPQSTTATLLPLVLRARHDPSEPVATAAAETWAELGGATAATLRANGAAALGPIVETLAGDAPSARRQAAATAAGGIAVDAGVGLPADQAAALAMALCVALPGRMLPFKTAVARSLASVAVAAPDAFTSTPPCKANPTLAAKLPQAVQATPASDTAIVKLLVATAVKKGSDTGAHEVAEAAGEALVKVLGAFKSRDHLGAMGPIQECAAAHAGTTASGASRMDTDEAEPSAGKLPLLKCLEALTSAVAHSAPATTATFTNTFAPCMCACLAPSRHWSVRAQCCRLAEKVFQVLEGSGSSQKDVLSTLLNEGEYGLLACALDVSTEKVSQAALPHISSNAAVQASTRESLKQMATGDKDPALRAQASRALQGPPFNTIADSAEPMQE